MTDEEILQRLKDWMIDKSCLRCRFWLDNTEVCDKFNQRPPAKVIVIGCLYHEFIPF